MAADRLNSSLGPMATAMTFVAALPVLLTALPALVPLGTWNPQALDWLKESRTGFGSTLTWITGFNGTIIVALYLDRAWGGAAVRPETRDQARHRAFVAAVAVAVACSQIDLLAAFIGAAMLDGHLNPATLFAAVPASAIVVALSLSLSARARPRLAAELLSLESYRESLLAATSRLDALHVGRRGLPRWILGSLLPVTAVALFVSYGTGPSTALQLWILTAYFATGWTLITLVARVAGLITPRASIAMKIGVGMYAAVACIVLCSTLFDFGSGATESYTVAAAVILMPYVFQNLLARNTSLTSFGSITAGVARRILRRQQTRNSEQRYAVRSERRREAAAASD